MLDHNTLSLIKPKRLYEDKDCIIDNGIIKMELGATTVLAPFVSKLPPVSIKVKDLWSGNLDEAQSISSTNRKLPFFETWNEVAITVPDVAVFSSLSSVGEDTFFKSVFSIDPGKIELNVIGLTWSTLYSAQKLSKGKECFFLIADWYLFYHLFQMFKELTGKKIAQLLWQEDRNYVYFTNEAKEYYVVCDKNNASLMYKHQFSDQVAKYFSGTPNRTTSYTKKQLQEEACSEVKHLLRPMGDLVSAEEHDHYNKYWSDRYTLYATKEKQ